MYAVVLVIHLLIVLALIGVVLLQRSEGGALGIGGGGAGSLFTSRGVGNALTRTTAILAAAFFVTSITLTILAREARAPTSVFEGVQTQEPGQQQPGGVLPDLPQGGTPQVPQVPE